MKIIKKNQLTILVLALMLVTAGYLNYNNNIETSTQIASIGDATLVSSNITTNSTNNSVQDITNNTENVNIQNNVASSITSAEGEETVETSIQDTANITNEYFNSSRLERETMYSQMLESYQKILDSNTTSSKQKEAAQKEINSINKIKNSIMISENLIKTKGFNDVVVFVNDESISVVINKEELNKEDIAQVQSIIAREMDSDIKDIHIMNK